MSCNQCNPCNKSFRRPPCNNLILTIPSNESDGLAQYLVTVTNTGPQIATNVNINIISTDNLFNLSEEIWIINGTTATVTIPYIGIGETVILPIASLIPSTITATLTSSLPSCNGDLSQTVISSFSLP